MFVPPRACGSMRVVVSSLFLLSIMFSTLAAPGTSRQTLGGVPSTPNPNAPGLNASGGAGPWIQTQTSPGPSAPLFGTPGAAGQQQSTLFSTPQHTSPQAFAGFSPTQATTQSPFATQLVPTASPAGAQPWTAAQASPMSQAPVAYLPGYLSKIRGGDRSMVNTNRSAETVVSPVVKAEADTSSILLPKEHVATSTAAPASPPNGFHSSFFARSSIDAGEPTRSPPPPGNGMREGSIFGYSSLRGSRPPPAQDEGDRSVSRAPTSPLLPASLTNSAFSHVGADVMDDDDDAPPQQALQDMPQTHLRAFDTSTASIARLPEKTQVGAPTSQGAPIAQRSVLVYGFPPLLRSVVVEQLAALGDLETVDDVSTVHAQDKTLRLVYREPVQALQAVLQNGKSMAGTCMIGVRWENDAMHQQSLIRGLDAPLLGTNSMDTKVAAAAVPSTPVTKANPPSTPAFGRPMEKIDTPGSVLAQPAKDASKKSTLQSLMNVRASIFGTAPQPKDTPLDVNAKPASLWGYVAESLFGW